MFLITSCQVNVSAQNDILINPEIISEIEYLSETIYNKLIIIENNNKNITFIVLRLNTANEYYEVVKNNIEVDNTEEFDTYVTNYRAFLRNIDYELNLIIRNIEIDNNSRLQTSLFLSILYILLGYMFWKFIIKSYKNRIQKLKPIGV